MHVANLAFRTLNAFYPFLGLALPALGTDAEGMGFCGRLVPRWPARQEAQAEPAFHRALEQEPARLSETGGRTGLLVVDLDGFKQVNDLYGHAGGDRLLASVAARLERADPYALVARIGGDEFGLLSQSVETEEELAAVVGQIHDAIAGEPFAITDDVRRTITATIGATLIDETTDPHDALRTADQRMYLAKRLARTDVFDRVTDLIVGLLSAGADAGGSVFPAGVAEVAGAELAFVDTGDSTWWWPETPDGGEQESLSVLAALARERDEVVEAAGEDGWLLAAPLRADDESIGAFAVARPFPFGKADRIALARTGLAVGQALRRLGESVSARRRIAELEALAYRDENTGLANRRALLAELERLERHDEAPVSLLFLDFDGLRNVNNHLGYERGNDLLRAVATAVEQTLSPEELVARLHGSGGDEFIVVCPRLDDDAARERAADLELFLHGLDLDDDLAGLYGGASVGHATREEGEPPLHFLERAATLMRTRKQTRKS
jgi:diguanylate cyclase (GGDEF)-like protein